MTISPILVLNDNKNITNSAKNSSISFGAQRLYRVKLHKVMPDNTIKEVDGFFSKLDLSDVDLINSVEKKWKYSTYGNEIVDKFKQQMRHLAALTPKFRKWAKDKGDMFFMIECPEFKNPLNRVCALAMVNQVKSSNELYISYLQSARSFMPHNIKAAGTMMLSGISKVAEQANKDGIYVIPGNLPAEIWYKKLGFKPAIPSFPCFEVRAEDFASFRERIKNLCTAKLTGTSS